MVLGRYDSIDHLIISAMLRPVRSASERKASRSAFGIGSVKRLVFMVQSPSVGALPSE